MTGTTKCSIGLLLLCSAVQSGSGIAQSQSSPPATVGLATILLPEEQEIELALAAGPEHVRTGATVYVFGTHGYSKRRSGTSGFTCMVNRDGNQHQDHDLKPTCWDAEGSRTIVPVMLRVGELIAKGVSAEQIANEVESGFRSAEFSSPRKAGVAYMLQGDLQFDPNTRAIVKMLYPPHYMIYAPGVTNADIGASLKPGNCQPWVYDGYSGGSRTAYIIVAATPTCHHAH